jgi:hypothetical protein
MIGQTTRIEYVCVSQDIYKVQRRCRRSVKVTHRITACHITKVEDQRHPRVSQSIFKAEIIPQSEDGGLAQERFVVVLESVGETHLPQ